MYTIEEKAARYIAVKEINSVLCEHCLYFGRRQTDLELERLWCRNATDPSFTQNNGRFSGYEALKKYYAGTESRRKARYDEILTRLEPEMADQSDELRYGTNTLSLQTLSTPCIEIAEDFETAKGLWTISAQVTALDDKGQVGFWSYGNLAADLVREDGQWKICHLAVYTDFVTPAVAHAKNARPPLFFVAEWSENCIIWMEKRSHRHTAYCNNERTCVK